MQHRGDNRCEVNARAQGGTIHDGRLCYPVLRFLCLAVMYPLGWRIEGQPPDAPKYILTVAPHTSNWDMPVFLGLAFICRLRAFWMGKAPLFRGLHGRFFRWLGGIPIDRTRHVGVVQQCVEAFHARDRMVLGILPEGTRRPVPTWKTGFYHIARGAGVPICCGYVDYRRKVAGFGPIVYPTGDFVADMEPFRQCLAGCTAKRPEQFCVPDFTLALEQEKDRQATEEKH